MAQTTLISPGLIPGLLFFDIETVAEVETYEELSPRKQELWNHQTKLLIKSGQVEADSTPQSVWPMAAIIPEFAKICSASFGIYIQKADADPVFYQRNYTNADELIILHAILDLFNTLKAPFQFSGYNIDTFDIPFMIKRFMIKLGFIPEQLNFHGKKPWEIGTLDLAKVWQGLGRSMCKFDLLAEVFGIESPKDEMYGGDVYYEFYLKKDLEKIGRYCDKDVLGTLKVALKMAGMNPDVILKSI